MKNYSTTKIIGASMKKERTTGNPKSKVGARAAAQNKKNMKKSSTKTGY